MRVFPLFPALSALSLFFISMTATGSCRAEALIAYTKDRAIYTATADGQHSRKICVGDDPCLSNDGRSLAYTRNVSAPGKSKHAPATRVIVVRELSTGKETLLPVGSQHQVYVALWSPDDAWIAYNVLTDKHWQVAAAHPDGSAFHLLTDKLPTNEGYYLAGWNLHDGAVLVQDLNTMTQIDPATGNTAWQRPVKELTGEDGGASSLRCSVSADGKLLVSTRFVENDEFTNLDGPSSYLVLADFPPNGKFRRATPAKFDASSPFLDPDGKTILVRGFGQKDVTTVKGSDGVRLKVRLYRYEIRSGKLSPLIEGGETPSASRP